MKLGELLKNPYLIFKSLAARGCFRKMDDKTYLTFLYRARTGRWIHWRNPKSFNEKLQWLKLYDRKPEYTAMVDKCEAKKYVAGLIGEEYIIPTLGVWERFDDIDFDSLPEQFVLKCTHDSGGLVICRDKSRFDREAARERINRSLKQEFFYNSREWPYKNVKPRILAEKYMEDENEAQGLTDYKFFCFNGEPRLLYVSQGLENHDTASISFFDMEGRKMPFCRKDFKPIEGDMKLPANFGEMAEVAAVLAKKTGCPFIRIDIYSVWGKLYFSEITFSPCSGMIPFSPAEWDEKLGEWITLPEKTKRGAGHAE